MELFDRFDRSLTRIEVDNDQARRGLQNFGGKAGPVPKVFSCTPNSLAVSMILA